MENIAENNDQQKNSTLAINIISIVIPVVVAILLALPNKLDLGSWTKNLPHYYRFGQYIDDHQPYFWINFY